MEQEVKLRVTVLRRLRRLKHAIPFQYIGMFAGAGSRDRVFCFLVAWGC